MTIDNLLACFCLLCGALLVSSSCAATKIEKLSQFTVCDAEDLPEDTMFDLTGIALFSENSTHNWFFSDGTGGTEIFKWPGQKITVRAGDRVHLQGHLVTTNDSIIAFKPSSCDILGHADLPEPVAAGCHEVASGRLDYQFVKLRGVLVSVTPDEIATQYLTVLLRDSSGTVVISCYSAVALDRLRTFVDAEVDVVGLAAPITGWRRHLGSSVRVQSIDSFRLHKPAPVDPLDTPALKDSKEPHRQHTSGVVLACGARRFFLRTHSGRMIPVHPTDKKFHPPAGSTVAVAGFAEMDPFHIRLVESICKTVSETPMPVEAPEAVDTEQLFTSVYGLKAINTRYHGQLIRLSGTVAKLQDDANFLRLESGSRQFSVEIAALHGKMPFLPTCGCKIEVTGLCLAEFNPNPSFSFPDFRCFTIVPRNPDDLRLLARPPWWTPPRLFMLVFILLLGIVSTAIWNRILNRKAERRGRQLYDERIRHALTAQKIEERTRLAVEIHDSISQTLTGVALQLDAASDLEGNAVQQRPLLDNARQMLASCRTELRNCLWDLRCRTFEEKDMTEAVARALEPYTQSVQLSIRFNVPRKRLTEPGVHSILKIIRELAVNALHHGKATRLRIAGECHDECVSFSVSDNGCGFNPAQSLGPSQGHFGLQGIRERIAAFDGELVITSHPGRATRVSVHLNKNILL